LSFYFIQFLNEFKKSSKKEKWLKIIYKKGPAVKQDLFSLAGTLLGHLTPENVDIPIS